MTYRLAKRWTEGGKRYQRFLRWHRDPRNGERHLDYTHDPALSATWRTYRGAMRALGGYWWHGYNAEIAT